MSSSNFKIGTFSSLFTQYEALNTSSSLSPFLVGTVLIVTDFIYSILKNFQMNGLQLSSADKKLQADTRTSNTFLFFVSWSVNFSARTDGLYPGLLIVCLIIPSFKFSINWLGFSETLLQYWLLIWHFRKSE